MFSFFWYRKFLERENKELKSRILVLESRNQELVLALFNKGRDLPEARTQKTDHHIEKLNEFSAKCTCGWNIVCDDPAKLQNMISSHYREFVVNKNRKTWAQTRDEAEKLATQEAEKEAKKEKTT